MIQNLKIIISKIFKNNVNIRYITYVLLSCVSGMWNQKIFFSKAGRICGE